MVPGGGYISKPEPDVEINHLNFVFQRIYRPQIEISATNLVPLLVKWKWQKLKL